MNTTQIAKRSRSGIALKRGDTIVSSVFGRLTFAYLADDGRIATQELGRLPVLHPAIAFHGVKIVNKERAS